MKPRKEVWRKNYYFARPHISRIGRYLPSVAESVLGRFLGACQLVEFKKDSRNTPETETSTP